MGLSVRVTDSATGVEAKITPSGQLVVGTVAYDLVKFIEMDLVDTAYNFVEPRTGKQFVITGLRLKADRGVSTTADAEVIFFEATSATSTTVSKVLFQENLVRGESATLMPLNIITAEGTWLNGTTTDDDIFATLMGYYIDAV